LVRRLDSWGPVFYVTKAPHTIDIKKRGLCSKVQDSLKKTATDLTLLLSSLGHLLNTANGFNDIDQGFVKE